MKWRKAESKVSDYKFSLLEKFSFQTALSDKSFQQSRAQTKSPCDHAAISFLMYCQRKKKKRFRLEVTAKFQHENIDLSMLEKHGNYYNLNCERVVVVGNPSISKDHGCERVT